MTDNEKIDIATCCRGETTTEHEHRELFSHMVVSHVFMILPCIYWVFYTFARNLVKEGIRVVNIHFLHSII